MIIEYKFEVTDFFGWGIDKGHIITFIGGDGYSLSVTDKNGEGVHHNLLHWHQKQRIAESNFESSNNLKLLEKKIGIESSCEPYMYNTEDDLNQFNIGDTIELVFNKKNKFRVRKKYIGKTVRFKVVNLMPHNWGRPTKRLALVEIEKADLPIEKIKDTDVLYLDDTDRFECLMIDLFPINRKPYAGWKQKKVKARKIQN
jgi:hypothetical protein